MELIDLIPEFNLYEEYWKIYTKSDIIEPQYLSEDSVVEKSIIGEGSEIYGEVHSSVIGAVTVKFIGEKTFSSLMTIRNYMLAEIASALVFHGM